MPNPRATFPVAWSRLWKVILLLVFMLALMEFGTKSSFRDLSGFTTEQSITQDNATETSSIYNKEETNSTDSTLESSHLNSIEVNDNIGNETYTESSNEKSDGQTDYPFVLVTGASKNHFCVLQDWLNHTNRTVQQFKPSQRPRIIVYDLGLTDDQYRYAKTALNLNIIQELRIFNYSSYPSFWKITNDRGQYAWKAGIIAEVARDYPGIIAWLDAGSWLEKYSVSNIRSIIDSFGGFASPISSGNIIKWTHPGVFDYFHEDPYKYRQYKNCNGAILIFDTSRVQPLIDAWLGCALVKDCIAPKGSSRKNHRQDQAILSFLAARAHLFCSKKAKYFGVILHQEDKDKCKGAVA